MKILPFPFRKYQTIKYNADALIISKTNEQREVRFKEVGKITIQPRLIWYIYAIENMTIFTKSGEEISMYNLGSKESQDLIKRVRQNNPSTEIQRLPLLFGDFWPDILLPKRVVLLFIAIAVVLFLIILRWATKQV